MTETIEKTPIKQGILLHTIYLITPKNGEPEYYLVVDPDGNEMKCNKIEYYNDHLN